MYTGIVQAVAEVVAVERKEGLTSLAIQLTPQLRQDLKQGASVAVDGVCLSVVQQAEEYVAFDAMLETLNKTTLGSLEVGSTVNIERSACQGDEVGGHILSGHVEGKAQIIAIEHAEHNHIVTFQYPAEWQEYIVHKGFIAVNGCSLTVVKEQEGNTFQVYFIPETLRATTFASKHVGDWVNIEIDTQTKLIVNTVKRYLSGLNLTHQS
ncbi:MAG: riboflavin synthase subunit alpha [Thiofilum sp.]|uniref:riboflavin synthase subunit alpha n=1 Tax=Thiofilum sp. TaxID=2212733 RepID=UPI0025E9B21B|nr:riboflavin synthase subunit alpha [Thiofilum sp.]MBK8452016.1 riboflavin synthase subunit alpha [Thiofilum sp.]